MDADAERRLRDFVAQAHEQMTDEEISRNTVLRTTAQQMVMGVSLALLPDLFMAAFAMLCRFDQHHARLALEELVKVTRLAYPDEFDAPI